MRLTKLSGEALLDTVVANDLDDVVRIDALHTGQRKPEYWQRVFRVFFNGGKEGLRVGLAAEADGVVRGYLLGEVRAFDTVLISSEVAGKIDVVKVEVGDRVRQIRAGERYLRLGGDPDR